MEKLVEMLKRHFNFTQEEINGMEEYEIFEEFQYDERFEQVFDLNCSTCNKETKFISLYLDDDTDKITLKCSDCSNVTHVHELAFDDLYEREDYCPQYMYVGFVH